MAVRSRSAVVPKSATTVSAVAQPAPRIDVRKTYKLYIGGAFPRTESGRSYLISAANGSPVANACRGSRKDVRDAVRAARYRARAGDGAELTRALAAGMPADKIVFSGVGKTPAEMRFALEHDVRQFNVESAEELEVLSAVASAMGKTAPITLRVNPDVDAKTHAKIATGKSENKFGIPISRARAVYAHAATLAGVRIVGIDVHIGSQLTDLAPFEQAYLKVAELTEVLRADGHNIRRLDLGGPRGFRHHDHAHAAVEGAQHFGLGHAALFA